MTVSEPIVTLFETIVAVSVPSEKVLYVTPPTVKLRMLSVSPSTSESAVASVMRFPLPTVSSAVVSVSGRAIGASLTAAIVRVRVAVEVPPLPSDTVYVTTGTVPFQLDTGANVYAPLALSVNVPLPVSVAGAPADSVWPSMS